MRSTTGDKQGNKVNVATILFVSMLVVYKKKTRSSNVINMQLTKKIAIIHEPSKEKPRHTERKTVTLLEH